MKFNSNRNTSNIHCYFHQSSQSNQTKAKDSNFIRPQSGRQPSHGTGTLTNHKPLHSRIKNIQRTLTSRGRGRAAASAHGRRRRRRRWGQARASTPSAAAVPAAASRRNPNPSLRSRRRGPRQICAHHKPRLSKQKGGNPQIATGGGLKRPRLPNRSRRRPGRHPSGRNREGWAAAGDLRARAPL